ncbi:hypothetical protein BJY52DRAFT_1093292, partial [Lactarius psammicola]
KVHLRVAIIPYKTKLKARRRGFGTFFLASLPVSKLPFVLFSYGLLALHLDPSRPVICVCPETVVAPACVILEACADAQYFGNYASRKDPHYSHGWTALA